jgi:uncharacterized membrane protein YphA (DoxX/SURF4 family)
MRRLLAFVAFVVMLVGGVAGAAFELVAKAPHFRFLLGDGALALVGAFLLWAVFVAPKFGIKEWEN